MDFQRADLKQRIVKNNDQRTRWIGGHPLAHAIALCTALIPVSGAYAASPVFPIFGSYFPAWLVCAVLGVIVTVVVRRILVATGVNAHLPLAPVVYLSLAVASSIGIWLMWTGGGAR